MPAVALPRAVRRALDLVESEHGRICGPADLARAVGVAPRTLEKHFRRVLGKTPGAVLREARLAHARRELLQGADGASITEIAIGCGFGHLGRFAAAYRARYGETPSATLRRRQAFSPPLPQLLPSGIPDRPTLAVLPLDPMGGHSRLARGITEELLT